jgi:hypothetical protein
MKPTRCKVKCTHTGQSEYGPKENIHTATFGPVYRGGPENEKFFAATPSITIEVAIMRQPFEVGKEYYIDFIPLDGEA